MSFCVFCDEFAGNGNKNFQSRYPELETRVIWQDEFLIALPCIGQLREGHFMILPKSHYSTFQKCNTEIADLNHRIEKAIQFVTNRLPSFDSKVFVFEHGARQPQDGGCGIYHAHLHVIPADEGITPSDVFGINMVDHGRKLSTCFEKIQPNSSYALAGYFGESFFCNELLEPLPSQFLRRKLSIYMGTEKWDWRLAGRETSMLDTVSSFQTK